MVIQVILKDTRSGAEQKLEFDQSPVRIGRNPLNNIVLEGNFVSGWHGIIRFDDTGTHYFDLGSTNGTLLDGTRLPKNTPIQLRGAARLTIWMFELTVLPDAGLTVDPARRSPPRPYMVDTLAAAGRTTEVFGAPSQPAHGLSQSQVSGTAKSAPSQPGPLAPQVGRSRIVSAGSRPTPVPPPSTPRSPSQAPRPVPDVAQERLMRCLRIIGAFSDAFMGLKKGYEQFGSEVGVRPLRGTTALHRARTSQEIVDYLLDPAVNPEACARDLNAVFADMGIHDLALIEGISQSLRSLLAKLDPSGLDLKAGSGLWSGGKAKAKWTSYVEMFGNLLGDDAALHAELFGEEFATGYASVARGDKGPDDSDAG